MLRTRVNRTRGALALTALTLAISLTGQSTGHAVSQPTAAVTPATAQAKATNRVTPGNFTGYGFDQCVAPNQAAMDAWLESSPFWSVGIYISGASRGCRSQPNLTPTWISTQLRKGWRLLPITLGPQAYCHPSFPRYGNDPVISSNSANNYAAAKRQGRAEAASAVQAAGDLGISPRSTLWYDLEGFDSTNNGCRRSALQFLSGWTERIREFGYVSGVYSSGASGIAAIEQASKDDAGFASPDMLWVADWNSQATVETRWIDESRWPKGLVHQYRGDHNETHGGVTIPIDSNFLDTGRGSTPRLAPSHCGGINLDLSYYGALYPGVTAPTRTKTAQCLLQERGVYRGTISGTYDDATASAVSAYRTSIGLPASRRLNARTWTSLLSAGNPRLVKYGAALDGVRRLQRSLNAAINAKLPITGVFAAQTERALKAYQEQVGLPATGVATTRVWTALGTGTLRS